MSARASAARRVLSVSLWLVATLCVLFVADCALEGRRWARLKAAYRAIDVGDERGSLLAELQREVGLPYLLVEPTSGHAWLCYTQCLSAEERARVTSLILFRSRGVVPSECVLYFSADGRLSQKQFDS